MLATRFGAMAVELLVKGESDRMVAFHPPEIGSIPLADVGGKMRLVPADGDVVRQALHDRLAEHGHERSVVVAFTTDRRWAL